MARFCSLFSSSSGNCTYIGSSSGGVLIDAGVSAKQISLKLSGIGVSEKDIGAVFVTHEHSDHVKGLRVFASKYNIPVYATEGTIRELEKMGIINGKFPVFPIGSGSAPRMTLPKAAAIRSQRATTEKYALRRIPESSPAR